MGRLKRRLERLEGKATAAVPDLSVEALQALSDEELDALEDAMEAAVASGDGSFQDLYAVVGERERRASSALFVALAAAHTGEELPVVRPGERCALGLLERIWNGDEEARREWDRRDGYRIWKHRRQGRASWGA